jgi:hypothetical protein
MNYEQRPEYRDSTPELIERRAAFQRATPKQRARILRDRDDITDLEDMRRNAEFEALLKDGNNE